MQCKFIVSLILLLCSPILSAQIIKTYTINSDSVCSSEESLIIISAHEIPELANMNVKKLTFMRILKHKPQPIVFQVDHKDVQGRYILSNNNSSESASINRFSDHDELVFRKKDRGSRLSTSSELLEKLSLIEIKIIDESADTVQKKIIGWVYIALNAPFDFTLKKQILSYQAEQDMFTSPLFKLLFSKEKPFLVDAFHWRLVEGTVDMQWSPDLTDTMKIRHIGNFFGFPFKRTDDDYSSKLVDIKQGPLRIIRRTENKVKVFWKLKSPALYIDYVMMPDGFVMDSMIDIPFKISFFFSNLATITTMDWNHAFEQPALTIHSPENRLNLPVNGMSSEDKALFNQVAAQEFSLSSQQGLFVVKLDIPDDFPIHSQLYLNDDLQTIDPPENYPGQFGNVGFKTTGWENIDSKLHHLKFTVCVDRFQSSP